MHRSPLNRIVIGLAAAAFALGASAQDPSPAGRAVPKGPAMDVPLVNWDAPQFYNLPKGFSTNLTTARTASTGGGKPAGLNEKVTLDLATFVPINPCRLVDTRGLFSPVYAGGAYAAGETRVYRASGNCGVPAGNDRVQAVSLAVTTPPTAASGDIEILSEAATLGGTVVMVIQAGQWNSATTISAVDAQGDFKTQLRGTAGHVVIDINGYYADTSTTQTSDFFQINGTFNFDGGLLYVTTGSANGAAINAESPTTQVHLAQAGNAIDIVSGGLRVRGAGINVDRPAFIHEVDTSNPLGTGTGTLCGGFPGYSIIDNVYSNGKPNAIVLISQVTRYGDTPTISHPSGANYQAYYMTAGNACSNSAIAGDKWVIRINNGTGTFTNKEQHAVLIISN